MDNNILELFLKMFGGQQNSAPQNNAFSNYPSDAFSQANEFNEQNMLSLLLPLLTKSGKLSSILSTNEKPSSNEIETPKNDILL